VMYGEVEFSLVFSASVICVSARKVARQRHKAK